MPRLSQFFAFSPVFGMSAFSKVAALGATILGISGILGITVLGFNAPAFAQAQEGSQSSSAWIKVCEKDPTDEKKEICVVTQELRGQGGNFLASAGVRTFDEGKKSALIFGLPLGMLLQPGIRYQIDQGEQTSGQFGICLPTGCFAEIPIEPTAVDSFKKGSELVLLAISGRGQTVPFRMSLVGFTKTFDGPPMDPKVLAATQRKLEEEIRKRAEERRKKLDSEQGSSTQEAPAAQ